MRYSKGICWVNDCRIPFVDDGDIKSQERAFSKNSSSHIGQVFNNNIFNSGRVGGAANPTNDKGRFTPNLLVCDDVLNDGVISKSDGRKIYPNEDTNIKNDIYNKGWVRTGSNIKDKGSNSRYYDLDLWFNHLILKL